MPLVWYVFKLTQALRISNCIQILLLHKGNNHTSLERVTGQGRCQGSPIQALATLDRPGCPSNGLSSRDKSGVLLGLCEVLSHTMLGFPVTIILVD